MFQKAFANVLVLFVVLSAGIMAGSCASGGESASGEPVSIPVLGVPTLLQEAMNLLPAIPIAGNNLKFQFGGEAWVARLNGQDFSTGTIDFQDTYEGVILTLNQTHIWPGAAGETAGRVAGGGVGSALSMASRVAGTLGPIQTSGTIILEYIAGPPASFSVLTGSDAADRIAEAQAAGFPSSSSRTMYSGFTPSSEGAGSAGYAATDSFTYPDSSYNAPAPAAVSGSSNDLPDNLLRLDAAIAQAARGVEQALSQGTVIMVLNFASPTRAFTDYVLEELTGELINGRRVAFVDRVNQAFVSREMNLDPSGNISDERAQGIGRTLGARSIVSGSLTNMGAYYRFRVRVINTETAAIQTQVSLDVQNDSQVAFLVGGRPTVVTQATPMPPNTDADSAPVLAQEEPSTPNSPVSQQENKPILQPIQETRSFETNADDATKNLISLESRLLYHREDYGFDPMFDLDIKYERMLSSRLLLGANVYIYLVNPDPFYDDYFESDIRAYFRSYTQDKTFFWGAGLGYHSYSYSFSYSDWSDSYSYSDSWFYITPEVGWKIAIGESDSSYFMPGLTSTISIGSDSTGFHFYPEIKWEIAIGEAGGSYLIPGLSSRISYYTGSGSTDYDFYPYIKWRIAIGEAGGSYLMPSIFLDVRDVRNVDYIDNTMVWIIPEVEWKIDLGKAGGFYLMGGIYYSIALLGESAISSGKFSLGMSYSF